MKGEFSSDDLKQLFALLSEKHPEGGTVPSPRSRCTEVEQRLLDNDSIERSDFQDLVTATDRRAWGQAGHYAPALAAYFRISEASLCRKPQHVDDRIFLFQGFCAADAVALQIYMESLGFRVFPERLVAKLKKRLFNKPVMTESEYRPGLMSSPVSVRSRSSSPARLFGQAFLKRKATGIRLVTG